MKAVLLAVLLAAGAVRAEESPVSFHGGVGIALWAVPSVQLQLEGKRWFVAFEAAAGLGGWGASGLFIGNAGFIFDNRLHPYLAAGAGYGSAYDLDELSGGGLAAIVEAGLIFGKSRSWGSVMPFIELPIATWTATNPEKGTSWRPGAGFPLIGVRLLL